VAGATISILVCVGSPPGKLTAPILFVFIYVPGVSESVRSVSVPIARIVAELVEHGGFINTRITHVPNVLRGGIV
jgi:hypothetical protein